jgi:SAM-dependent methyltransferase
MTSNFDEYAAYYDLIYKDKDYEAEVAYVERLINVHYGPAQRILEFGSGTGIHGNLLATGGRVVKGIELSSEMAARSEVTKNFSVTVGDISEVNLNERFEIVIALFHVISYLTDREKRLQVFLNASQHLESDGLFIFDVWHTDAVSHQKPKARIKIAQSQDFELVRLAEPTLYTSEKNVGVKYTIFIRAVDENHFQRIDEDHLLHHFDLAEIIDLADASGFKVIKSEEFLSAATPSEDTWGVSYVLKKI